MQTCTKKYRSFFLGLLVGIMSVASVSYSHYFEVSKNLEIFSTLFKELDVYYVDEIKPGELTQTGIDAMLKSLDPYTTFIPESEIEDHRLTTTGQYGGIGAVVRKRGEYIVISEPYEGSPAHKAGIMAGDLIIEVNGQSTKGKTNDEVVKILRGAPNSTVTLVIQREATQGTLKFEVVREEIKIKNVPYYGMVDDKIGYIKLRGFTNNAGNDVKEALQEFKKNHELKGVILDLRGNPGGLLREAINVVNVFVDRNQLVVSTKGKVEEWNKSYKTLNAAVDTSIPLAVLVNRGSASASEIVSGTIQDLDRGVVIGQRTFGKGLVQTSRPLVYNTQLKVTTSKYYIPSGRCIQALDYSNKNADGSAGTIADSLRNKFKTQNGRIVYDGGGIYPDIPVKIRKYSKVLGSLLNNNHIFDYATLYRAKHDKIADAKAFKVDQTEYDLFLKFLEGKSYEYTTYSEKLLEEFQQTAKKEKYFEYIENEYNNLVDKKQHTKNKDILKFREEIAEFLTEEIVSRYYYQRGRIEASLTTDQEVKEAIALLKDKTRYQSIFEPSFEIKPLDEENGISEEEMVIEEE